MTFTFNSDVIAVYRPTHKEYDFLRYGVNTAWPNHWSTIEPPTIEGIHKNYQHNLNVRTSFLNFRGGNGYKRLDFYVLDDILKVTGEDWIIPVIRLRNGARYTNTHNKIKRADIANIVIPAGQQIAQANQVAPAPAPPPVRTPVIIPSNLPRSMIPHFKEVAQSIDIILTNNTISAQEKGSQIMNRFARSIRDVIHTVEHEKVIPQFVAQVVAQRSAEQGETCPITCDDITVDIAAVTSCFHVFSKEAIQMYRTSGNMTCPVCRQHCSVTNVM